MALSVNQIIEMGWRSTQTKTGNQIVIALFSGSKTQEELRKTIEKNLNKEYEKKLKELAKKEKWSKDRLKSEKQTGRRGEEYKSEELHNKSLYNLVSNYLNAFEKLGYCLKIGEKKRISKFHRNFEYGLQLKFFFDYANEKLPKGKKFVYKASKKDDWGDGWFLDYDLILKRVREIILKYPVKTLLEKIKLYLFDTYVMQGLYLRKDDNTREKIRLLFGLDPKISKEVREYHDIDSQAVSSFEEL